MTADPAAERLARLFGRQANSVVQRGSPLYTHLMRRVATDVLAGGPSLDLLRPRAAERSGQALPLRLMAAAHRLALSGSAPRLAAHLPSTGGDGHPAAAWSALLELIDADAPDLNRLLATAIALLL